VNTVQIEALRVQRACSFHRQTQPLLQNRRSQPRNPKASLRRGFSDSHPGLIWHTSSLKSTVFMCAGFHFKSAGHVPGAYGTMTCPHSCRETVSTLNTLEGEDFRHRSLSIKTCKTWTCRWPFLACVLCRVCECQIMKLSSPQE
jgi:hypothetical protein